MLVGGYLGEVGTISATLGFIIGMVGWLYIVYEVFAGEASKINSASGNQASQTAFNALRLIVTIGWSIYPIGYVLGYMAGAADAASLNLIYNLADFVNKIAFGVVIWAAATVIQQIANVGLTSGGFIPRFAGESYAKIEISDRFEFSTLS